MSTLSAHAHEDPVQLAMQLESAIALRLGASVRVAVAANGPDALAGALRAAGRAPAPPPAWPCPYASLTHSGDVAIAVALPAHVAASGLGVDLELDRTVKDGMARLICDRHERAWLAGLPADRRAAQVLRLWTAKEALYKADPAQGDAIIAEYALASPGDEVTTGGRGPAAQPATVVSLRVANAFVSVALRPPGGAS